MSLMGFFKGILNKKPLPEFGQSRIELNKADLTNEKQLPGSYKDLVKTIKRMQAAGEPINIQLESVSVGGTKVYDARRQLPILSAPTTLRERPPRPWREDARRDAPPQNHRFNLTSKPSDDPVPSRGLVVRAGPLGKILTGNKTLELRSKHNRQLGPIALIQQGSKKIYGVAEIVESIGPMSMAEFKARSPEHGVEPDRLQQVFDEGHIIGWRMANIRRLSIPVPYIHKGMSQVKLDETAIQALRIALKTAVVV